MRTAETSLVLILWTKLEQIEELTTGRRPIGSQPSHAGLTNGKSAPEEIAIRRRTTAEVTSR